MKKFNITICSAILLFLIVSVDLKTAEEPPRSLTNAVTIVQNDKQAIFSNGMFQIKEEPFNLIVNNISLDDNVAIFAYHNDEMFQAYSYPIETKITETFAPATVLAMTVDESKSFFLRINKKNTQTYITSDRRINEENKAILKIKGFADSFNRYSVKKIAYISIFVDFNKNEIIEKNEIENIVVKVNPSFNSDRTELPKVYVSGLGSSIELYENYEEMESDFIIFKITNSRDAELFSSYMAQNTNYYSRPYPGRVIPNMDYNTKNEYFLMTPRGMPVVVEQPYHYSGENDLIFDISSIDDKVNESYISLKTYLVNKENDIFTLKINWKGQLISPVLIDSFNE